MDEVEAISGYDLLALLPDHLEQVIERGSPPVAPVAELFGPAQAIVGVSVSFDGSSSSDPDGDALSYAWDLGDGSTATGTTVTHSCTDAGTFRVQLRVTDPHGLSATETMSVVVLTHAAAIADVIPLLESLAADGALSRGEINSLSVKLEHAAVHLEAGRTAPALGVLGAFVAQVEALAQNGRIDAAAATQLIERVLQVVQAIEA